MSSRWARCAAVALCAAIVGGCTSGSSSVKAETLREALERLAPEQPLRRIADVGEPSSYGIEYARYIAGRTAGRIVRSGGHKRKALTPTHVVRDVIRPFNESGTVSRRLGFLREAAGATSRVSLVRPLPDDARPRIYPADDKPTRQRTVVGRRCTVHVIDADEYCVDAAGLVLVARTAKTLEVANKVTIGHERRTADQLRAALASGFINVDRGSIRPIDPDSAPGGATDYSLDAAPEGFALVGRYAVVGLSRAVLDRQSRKVIAGIVDVYVNGLNTLVVERGGKLDTSNADEGDLGSLGEQHDVDLGAIGTGVAGIGGEGPYGYREVRATPSQGRYLVVAGTVPEDQLVMLARSLHAWPGTQIKYLDHPTQGPKVPRTTASGRVAP
ncbi:MAG: hypothetical protein QOG90_1440 [Actinomycetota bacterium]|jgi:hypothetical protein